MAWPRIAHLPPLVKDEVHVWLADLSHGGDSLAQLASILSEDERERAARFHFQRDAGRWIVSRVVLRSILGRYLGVEAPAIRFCAGPWGKPELTASFQGRRLQFNASRSDGLGLYAVARSRRVGVDIERLRPLSDLGAIAAQMFSSREQQALGGLPLTKRCAAFFTCWTRKEAYIKALGEGLAHPLDRFTVSLSPDAPAQLEDVQDNPAAVGRWSLAALAPAAGYAAAVAIEGPPARLVCAQWQERAS
jgi:4'-phosphopantetheinyl transferase